MVKWGIPPDPAGLPEVIERNLLDMELVLEDEGKSLPLGDETELSVTPSTCVYVCVCKD